MIRRSSDICTHRVSNKIIEVVPEVRIEQFLQGRSDSVNYRAEIARLIFSWTLDLFQGSHDDTALGMTEYNNQACSKASGSKLDASNLGRCDDISCNTDDEKISKFLVKHDFCGNPRI